MISKNSLQFLEDLKSNNNRDWFLANKKRYDGYKTEYHQLIGALLDELKPQDAALELLEVKNCTFRINRDIRFSKDKSPYKTYMGIWFRTGAPNSESTGYYIHIEKGTSFIGGGLYCPTPVQLKNIRKEINFFNDELNAILNNKYFKTTFGTLNRSENATLKNPPKGYDKDNLALEHLKLKSYTAILKFDTNLVTQKEFITDICKKLILLKPLNEFLNRAITCEE